MSRPRCSGCNRWLANDRQIHRWTMWTMRMPKWWAKLTTPLWWRLDTTCLDWNDCPGNYPAGYRKVSPVIVRLFKVTVGQEQS